MKQDFQTATAVISQIVNLDEYKRHDMVGSAVYREDAADIDILIEVGDVADACEELDDKGWTYGGSQDPQSSNWATFRKGVYNLIVVGDAAFYDRMKLGSDLCAELQLPTKRDRIILHRVIRDGMSVENAKVGL